MNKIELILLCAAIVTFLVVLSIFVVKAYEPGGFAHGDWIERNDPHGCTHPFSSDGAIGNTWRCRKCKQIWIKQQYKWERMN